MKLLCTPNYIQAWIANTGFEEEKYYLILLANKDGEETGEFKLSNIDLTDFKKTFELFELIKFKKNWKIRWKIKKNWGNTIFI